ncbi:hypothetical protein HYV79_00155 [Candidatus Woesearchaeota archaeon]|nr:hypothetical protein [Candidatus Woesearchaeota archaeon]
MTCSICGKIMCDHSPSQRGQTLSQMLDSMYEGVISSAHKAIDESSRKVEQNKDLADIVLKINGRNVVVKGSPTYINDESYKAPPENSRVLAIVHNFGVNYAKAFQETKKGREMLNPSELEALLKKDRGNKDRYHFWYSDEIFLNLTRYESRPQFMPLLFGYDECIKAVTSYYSSDFGGWSGHFVDLEIPSPNESPRLEIAHPKKLLGVWKKCQPK